MSVRMRHTRAHTKNRRSHHSLGEQAISNDAKDGVHLRHRVSPITGKYKGEQVLNITKKEAKKAVKEEVKAEKETKKEEVKEVKKEKVEKKEDK